MRYLLDELMAYEEGFSDIMMDDRAYDRHETFMGEDDDPQAAVSKSDLVKFEDNLMRKIGSLLASSGTPSSEHVLAGLEKLSAHFAQMHLPQHLQCWW
jgi:hypothetical protein